MEQREELSSFSGECFMNFVDAVVLREWRVSQSAGTSQQIVKSESSERIGSAPTDSTVLLCIGAGSGAWFELFELVFVQVSQLEVGP